MADRINDTDPQSPRALVFRTDPGLGGGPAKLGPKTEVSPIPPPAVPTPSPGSASIEELLDGITGPRPPPSRREAESARAYSAARPAPPPQARGPHEPLVVSPEPPLYSGAGREPKDVADDAPPKVDPESTRPVVKRRPAEERTVYTGRRALLRKIAVVVASSAVVALIMMTTMRWREAHRPRQMSAVVVMPAVPDPEVAAGGQAPPVATVAPALVPALVATSVDVATLPMAAPVKPIASASRRTRVEVKPAAPPVDALDDLNRQIRH